MAKGFAGSLMDIAKREKAARAKGERTAKEKPVKPDMPGGHEARDILAGRLTVAPYVPFRYITDKGTVGTAKTAATTRVDGKLVYSGSYETTTDGKLAFAGVIVKPGPKATLSGKSVCIGIGILESLARDKDGAFLRACEELIAAVTETDA